MCVAAPSLCRFCCIAGQPRCKKECQLLHNALFASDSVRGSEGPSWRSQMEWNGLKMVSERGASPRRTAPRGALCSGAATAMGSAGPGAPRGVRVAPRGAVRGESGSAGLRGAGGRGLCAFCILFFLFFLHTEEKGKAIFLCADSNSIFSPRWQPRDPSRALPFCARLVQNGTIASRGRGAAHNAPPPGPLAAATERGRGNKAAVFSLSYRIAFVCLLVLMGVKQIRLD